MSADRDVMIATIKAQVRTCASALGRGELSARVIAAVASVPREAFVQPEQRRLAYRNAPLPIACGQTISQRGIVAMMTDLLEVLPSHRVLEIGTGSGYQAAVLSLLAAEVSTIETLEPAPDLLSLNMPMSRCGTETERVAGLTRRHSTASWSRRRCEPCHRPLSSN